MQVGHVSYYIDSIFIIFINFLDAMRPWLTMQPYLRSPIEIRFLFTCKSAAILHSVVGVFVDIGSGEKIVELETPEHWSSESFDGLGSNAYS